MKTNMTIEVLAVPKSTLGESAVWDARRQQFLWVDIPEGLIHLFNPESGETETVAFDEPVGCVTPCRSGHLLVGAKSGLWTYDPATGKKSKFSSPEKGLPDNRFNDGSTDRQGRFWAGTMKSAGEPEPLGSFYRVTSDLSVSKWRDGFFTTNGLAFSPGGDRMYFSDSNAAVRMIWQADYDQGAGIPYNVRPFFDTKTLAGRPDGATVDADGCYWSAGVGGGQLYRFTPNGELDLTVDLPVQRPTKIAFGGAGLDQLYVTCMGEGAGFDVGNPSAGSVLLIEHLNISGVAQTDFAR